MPSRKTTRRQFLRGASAVEALGDLTHGVADSLPAGPPAAARSSEGAYLLEVSRPAMACQFAVYLNAGQHDSDAEAAVEALDVVDALEDQMTVYRDHSEICAINRRAADEPVDVEAGLFELLARGVEIYQETEGAFDMTAGPLSKVWGFFRRAGTLPDEESLAEALSHVGSDAIELDRERRTICFRRSGVEINLGGIGKGHALDVAARQLQAAGVDDFLIHGGQSSVLARGSRIGPRAPSGGGWTVGVKHPLRPERRLAEIHLRNRALGTSGSAAQSFYHQGRRYGHILDPRSGWPAEGVLSSTVVAPRAADADALATAFYVLGPEAALDYCGRHDEIAALLVTAGERRGAVEFHHANLADEDWRCLGDK